MAYTIHELQDQPGASMVGAMIDSGQTRDQVIGALRATGKLRQDEPFKYKLPRFGRAMAVVGPRSYVIVHR